MTGALAIGTVRPGEAEALKWTLAVSAAAHLALFAALALTVDSARPKPLPPLRAYRVNLAPPAPAAAAVAPVEAAPAPPAPKEKPVSVAEKVPEKTKAPAPKKEASKPKESAAPAKGSSRTAGGGPASAGGVVGRLEGGDFEFTWYLDSIQRKISQTWLKPTTLSAQADTMVYFRIQRDGRVTDAAVTQASGDAAYDRAALRAVLAAAPMPPLPRKFEGGYLGVHFSFMREETP